MGGALAELVDRQAIIEQIYRYCRAMDRIDNDLGRAVWHPDGTADYGAIFQGTGAQFVDWVSKNHARMRSHSHQVANILVWLDGDRATSEAYVTAALREDRDGGIVETVVRGRYVDRWSRRQGCWAIDHRRYVHDMDETRPIVAAGMAVDGRRDRTDPSYS